MLTLLFLLGALIGQEDELLRVFMDPGGWAAAVSRLEGRSVEKRDIAAVSCVGIVSTDMFCSWQRRKQHKWLKYSGRADLSRENSPMLKDAVPDKPSSR